MGRRQVELTEEQLKDQKERWFGEERNSRRRAAYANRPEVRTNLIAASRRSYRAKREADGASVRQDEDCRDRLPELASYGQMRDVTLDGKIVMVRTFRAEEFAQVVGRSLNVVYRWFSRGLAPKPVLRCGHAYRDERGRIMPAMVYVAAEVEAMVQVFGEHQKTSQYFRDVHTETQDRMRAAVDEVRRELGIEDETTVPARAVSNEQRSMP